MKVNPWNLMSPEKRRAAIEKSVAARRENKAKRDADRLATKQVHGSLSEKVLALTEELSQLSQIKALNSTSKSLSGDYLLTAESIIKASMPFRKICGVYFLISGGAIVYVGQSVDVLTRLGTHENFRSFDSYAYIEVEKSHLDLVESLYIHAFNPPLNGDFGNGCKQAPISLKNILAMVSDK